MCNKIGFSSLSAVLAVESVGVEFDARQNRQGIQFQRAQLTAVV